MGSIGKWARVLTIEDRQRIALAVRIYGPQEHMINNREIYPDYDGGAVGVVTFLDRKIVIAALLKAHRGINLEST
jgi:hypothetical protein